MESTYIVRPRPTHKSCRERWAEVEEEWECKRGRERVESEGGWKSAMRKRDREREKWERGDSVGVNKNIRGLPIQKINGSTVAFPSSFRLKIMHGCAII